eukprot:scaffold60730_cov75-Phaeocystis_antarctica.AAC.8
MCTRNACGEHAVCTRNARGVHAVCTRCARGAHAVVRMRCTMQYAAHHFCWRSPKPPSVPRRYAKKSARRKGQPRPSWTAAQSAMWPRAPARPLACSSSSSRPGAERRTLALTETPSEHGEPEAEHRPAVVEESQHIDGRPRRHPARPRDGVACDAGAEGRNVARGHCKLRRQHVGAVVRQPPDGTVQVDEAARIDERPGLAAQQRVIVDAVHERPLHLLHVRLEVDRRVADHLDDQQAEDELAEENQRDQRNSRVPRGSSTAPESDEISHPTQRHIGGR